MSTVYHTEPPTQGKVLLKTSYGDIDIELWPKEAPLACRNFVQLCMEGYYDGSPINRIIKQFMVQMGDPTGTGKGGESIWGRPFKDEFHGRLKFNHRGLVAMANENATPHTNRSQFFLTLGPCEWLNKKHTIFGKITGNTIFNVLRLDGAETDETDKPLENIILIKAEILSNPFDDIIPRDLSKQEEKSKRKSKETIEPVKEAVKLVRNTKLLSFGDEEENDESYQAFTKKKINTSSTIDVVPEIEQQNTTSAEAKSSSSSSKSKKSHVAKASNQPQHIKKIDDDNYEGNEEEDMNAIVSASTSASNRLNDAILEEKKKEFDKLRQDLLRSKRAVKLLTTGSAAGGAVEADSKEMFTPLEQMRQKYLKRKQAHGSREEETLAKLSLFTDGMKKSKSASKRTVQVVHQEACYHGQVLERGSSSDEEGDEEGGDVWHDGKLKFRKHIDDKYRNN